MSWSRPSSVPPAVLPGPRMDQGDQDGYDQRSQGHDSRDLQHDGRRDLRQGEQRVRPNGSDRLLEGRALLQGGHGGALLQELHVSTDLLDLGTESMVVSEGSTRTPTRSASVGHGAADVDTKGGGLCQGGPA